MNSESAQHLEHDVFGVWFSVVVFFSVFFVAFFDGFFLVVDLVEKVESLFSSFLFVRLSMVRAKSDFGECL